MSPLVRFRLLAGTLLLLGACSSGTSGGGTTKADAASPTGGGAGNGGGQGSGGSPGGGGAPAAGGVTATSGAPGSGGVAGTGGLSGLGGGPGSGGAPVGGAVKGGTSGTAGAPNTGGATGAGGTSAAGGATLAGGTTGTGGTQRTGGALGTGGGTPASGGSRATGGAQGSDAGTATDASTDAPSITPGTTPPITPRWAFEPWAWEDNTNTRQSTEALIAGYISRQIPVGAVIIDSPWETTFNTLSWDTTRYPSPQAMIDGFHTQGVKVIMWLTAFVDTDAPQYQTAKAQNYGVNNNTNATWWKGTGLHVDITNPAAATWWNGLLGGILANGIDGWKLDRGADYIGDPITTAAGSMSAVNFKKRLSADFFDTTISKNPNGIVMVRPYDAAQGGVGSDVSKCSMGWVGDHDGGFSGIATQMSDIYTSAQMGYGAPGVEVGGYVNAPSKNSLIRYAEFGALTPLMENGGTNGGQSQHLPWFWDAATVTTYQYFATLHSELGSYNFSYGVDAHLTGTSIIRGSDKVKGQHLLGDQLLASVITTDVTTKSVSFPTGSNWIDYWNEDTVFTGGTTTQYAAPLAQYPIFIKTGAIIPMDVKTAVAGHGDTTSAGKITVLVYPQGKSSFTFHRPLGEGTTYEDVGINVDVTSGTIAVSGATATSYRLRVKSMQAPTDVTGADTWSYDATKKVVTVDKQGATFSIVVSGLKGYP
jgi:alpha-glucosidase (family GH31 glycosyl hydrolase)